jgi:hypothetical protein
MATVVTGTVAGENAFYGMRNFQKYVNIIFEVFTMVTMTNVIFWDVKTHFIPHTKHITSPLQRQPGYCYVRSEVFTAVAMKNAVFWDIKTHFVPHMKHIMSPVQSPAG